MRKAVGEARALVIAGALGPAAELHVALFPDADPKAVRDLSGRPLADYDLEAASVLVYVVEGERASADDEATLKRADRKGVPAVCVLVGGGEDAQVPYVLATDVIPAPPGEPLPVERIAARVVDRLDEDAYVLARRIPALRKPACEEIVRRVSKQNAALGAAIFVPGADMPILTVNQIRMVVQIAAAYGEEIDRERALELLAVLGAGLGLRSVARQALAFVPGAGWALKGGVAYAGTRALGKAAIAYFERGGSRRVRGAARSVRPRS